MHRYEIVGAFIRNRIASGTLAPGDRLPSVRQLASQLGYSIITVHHAYALLESEGVIGARSRSGFFVLRKRQDLDDFPEAGAPEIRDQVGPVSVAGLTYATMSSWHSGMDAFGGILPGRELFDGDAINRSLRQVLRARSARTLQSDPPEGNLPLREAIARRLARRGIVARASDIVISGTGMHGLDLCLDVLARHGDAVMVETPAHIPILTALQRKGLMALEIYSHPRTGVDPDQFAYLLDHHPVRACLLSPTHHFPTGVSYPDQALALIARRAGERGVPIIEIDLFSELSYEREFARSLKLHDEADNVLMFGSFLGVLGPDYGIGWVMSRARTQALLEQKFLNGLAVGEELIQQAVARHVHDGTLDRDIRQLREKLSARMSRGMELVAAHFPPGCAVSRPDGGFMCWVRGPQGFDALQAARTAFERGIGLAAGPLFSPAKGFGNFLGLNFSAAWTPANVEKLKAVAALLAEAPS